VRAVQNETMVMELRRPAGVLFEEQTVRSVHAQGCSCPALYIVC